MGEEETNDEFSGVRTTGRYVEGEEDNMLER